MIFNEIKCHVNTFLGLVGGDASPASPLCPRLPGCLALYQFFIVINYICD